MLIRELATAREVVEAQILGVREILETRLNGMDIALSLLQRSNDRIPGDIMQAVSQHRQLNEEKFRSIEIQFRERDTRTEQTSKDSKVAVDAALQAAKEAVGEQNRSNALAIAKSETAVAKQIDQIGIQITTQQAGSNDKIDDIRSRLQVIEGTKKGVNEVWGYIGVVLGVVIAAASMLMRR